MRKTIHHDPLIPHHDIYLVVEAKRGGGYMPLRSCNDLNSAVEACRKESDGLLGGLKTVLVLKIPHEGEISMKDTIVYPRPAIPGEVVTEA